MTSLSAGRWHVEINDDRLGSPYAELGDFLQSVNEPAHQASEADFRLELTTGYSAHTFVDPYQKSITLRLPLAPAASMHVACIAMLQAAFRGLALLADDPALVLLHGGAVATRDSRTGIAVIDGGTGAGKTSLGVALAELGYLLVADEFLVCEARGDQLDAFSQPNLPWHIRPDMAPYLPLSDSRPGLRTFPQLASADVVPIRVLVIPDWSLPVPTCLVDSGKPPEGCLTDHLAKFADPSLDHVSLFTQNPGSLTASGGSHELHALLEHRIAMMRHSLLSASASLTLLRVGIGPPSEIGLAAQAVAAYLDDTPL
jgi:hypothetical protein